MRLLIIHCLLALFLRAALAESPDEPTGHLKPFGEQGPVYKIDTVDGFIPPVEFLTKYVSRNRPLLFKGPAKVSPAFDKWTDAYLSQATPPRPAGDVHIEHTKKENRSQKYSYIHFKEFLEIYNTSEIYMVSPVPKFLHGDLVIPFPMQCRFFLLGGLDTHVAWFSSGGTSSVIHHDSYENLNCLYRGRKTLVLLNTTKYQEQVTKMIDRPEGAFSTADVDSIDVKSRPEFSGLEFHLAEMEAGDCLYIPHLWVHQVRSFGNNLAVNLWWNYQNGAYKVSQCAKRFNRNLKFSQVYFGATVPVVRRDVNAVRSILASNLPSLPATAEELLGLLIGRDPARVSSLYPTFSSVVYALFRSLDTDKDGSLSSGELRDRMKYKEATAVENAVMDYNVQVFAMHEAAAPSEASELPKLFAMRGSDKTVYAEHRTWQNVKRPADEL